MKTGLIMEGGGMRGLYTAGVIDVLLENEITFDAAIGVSAGAAFGCNFKSKQHGRPLRYNLNYCKDPRYNSIRSLIKTGDLFGAEFCYKTLPFELDIWDQETYQNNPMDFYVVCSDIESGKPVYIKCNNGDEKDIQWIRASSSLPLVSRVVEIDGGKYLDGGIADSIPIEAFEKMGYRHNLVILTQPAGYVKGKNPTIPLLKLKMGKYPNFIKTMAERHIVYNHQLQAVAEAKAKGRAFVIQPSKPLEVGRADKNPKNLQAAYDLGRADALSKITELKEFLAKAK